MFAIVKLFLGETKKQIFFYIISGYKDIFMTTLFSTNNVVFSAYMNLKIVIYIFKIKLISKYKHTACL